MSLRCPGILEFRDELYPFFLGLPALRNLPDQFLVRCDQVRGPLVNPQLELVPRKRPW